MFQDFFDLPFLFCVPVELNYPTKLPLTSLQTYDGRRSRQSGGELVPEGGAHKWLVIASFDQCERHLENKEKMEVSLS